MRTSVWLCDDMILCVCHYVPLCNCVMRYDIVCMSLRCFFVWVIAVLLLCACARRGRPAARIQWAHLQPRVLQPCLHFMPAHGTYEVSDARVFLTARVGQNHIYIVYTVLLAEKSPNIRSYTVKIYGHIRSYTVKIYGSGQPYWQPLCSL
jgi:hypothetical protein